MPVDYDQAFLGRLADQTDTLPDGSPVVEALKDYGVLREQARSC